MPESRKRGGKKAHNKRIAKRNQKIQGAQKKFKEAYTKMFEEKMEELQNKFSGLSENSELDAQQVADSLAIELPKPISTQE